MRNSITHLLSLSFIALCLAGAPGSAQAQASRTWVSGVGDDVNPCSRTAPCKTFAGAISKTAVNGEINCLDPGGFGGVTITKSITIDCHEVFASILNAGTAGINVAFDSFGGTDVRKTVNIRNINIQGFDIGTIGIHLLGAGVGSHVNIEDCMINGDFAGAAGGIVDDRGSGTLKVLKTTVRNFGAVGISATSSNNGLIRVMLSEVNVENANVGIRAGTGAAIAVSRSTVTDNAVVGVRAESGSQINLDSTVIAHNAVGLTSGGTVRMSNNDFSFNTTGVTGTSLFSYSNNRFGNNGAGDPITPIGSTTNPSGMQ